MTEMIFSRPFSYHAPHMAEFFLVSHDSSCLLTNDKSCAWRLSWFSYKFHHVDNICEAFFVWIRSYRAGIVTNYINEVENINFQWASWRKLDHFNKSAFFLVFSQTSDMQWTYDILGTTADYNPPNARARITSNSANSARRTVKQKKNYVLENLKLQSTAVSSPYKGVRLVSRSAR